MGTIFQFIDSHYQKNDFQRCQSFIFSGGYDPLSQMHAYKNINRGGFSSSACENQFFQAGQLRGPPAKVPLLSQADLLNSRPKKIIFVGETLQSACKNHTNIKKSRSYPYLLHIRSSTEMLSKLLLAVIETQRDNIIKKHHLALSKPFFLFFPLSITYERCQRSG